MQVFTLLGESKCESQEKIMGKQMKAEGFRAFADDFEIDKVGQLALFQKW